jgi:Fe-Mn family superoxide dismutase
MFSIPAVQFLHTGIPGFLSPHAVKIHVTKHHQSYVDWANKNVPGSEFAGKPIEEILHSATGAMFNNVAQHYNHSFFWECLTARKLPIPPAVTAFVNRNFGGLEDFKAKFTQQASTLFGSGWCFVVVNPDKSVAIKQYQNALNPVKDGGFPILCIDTWEHAWYIDYQNRKAEYVAKFWDAVNWSFVEQRVRSSPF